MPGETSIFGGEKLEAVDWNSVEERSGNFYPSNDQLSDEFR